MAYFDCNATVPLLPEAREAMVEGWDRFWANPSTGYALGVRTRRELDRSRERIANCLGVEAGRVIFTSGASEANNAILRNFCARGHRVAISSVEHPAVHVAAGKHAKELVYLPVNAAGCVDLARAEELLNSLRPAGVSVMAVNNETGVLQPWREVLGICRRLGLFFHCDAAQLPGKASLEGLGKCDALTLSGHKFGGPLGAGILLVGDQLHGLQVQAGGEQEFGMRAGTEAVPLIRGLATALETTVARGMAEPGGRDLFESRLRNGMGAGLRIFGEGADRVGSVSYLGLGEFSSQRWVSLLDRRGFQVSSGAACSTGKEGPSRVLAAMGVDQDSARRSIRVSGSASTSPSHWEALANAFLEVREQLLAEKSGNGGSIIDLSEV